jgi:hypothetical protein
MSLRSSVGVEPLPTKQAVIPHKGQVRDRPSAHSGSSGRFQVRRRDRRHRLHPTCPAHEDLLRSASISCIWQIRDGFEDNADGYFAQAVAER